MNGASVSDRVRLYHSVRTAHLERARSLTAARIVYRSRRYDFDESLATGLDLVQASPLRTAAMLLVEDVRQLEINEPLMRNGLWTSAVALAAVALRDLLTRRRTSVVTYAIENDDPFGRPEPTIRRRLRRTLELALAHAVHRRVDRIAFGTDGARRVYEHRFRRGARTTATTIPALPEARSGLLERRAGSVVFLGGLIERKGVARLLDAWPAVRDAVPEATLTVLGKGPLEPLVLGAAAVDPTIEVVVDPARDRIFEVLDRVSVVVLPSVRTPRWREQVGLPIVEGLSSGCVIVTTTETGLAAWLRDQGHQVVDPDAEPTVLAAAIRAALADPRSAADVISVLPDRDGRLAADDWLFGREEEAS